MNDYFNPKRIVFLSWALILLVGFLATHFYQHPNINYIWTFLSVIGLFIMYKYMPLRVPSLRNTFYVWLGVIVIGMVLSIVPFYIESQADKIAYLGAYWLILMGVGFILNGLVYPMKSLYFSGVINLIGGILCLMFMPFLEWQYVLAALLGAYGMVHLTFYSN